MSLPIYSLASFYAPISYTPLLQGPILLTLTGPDGDHSLEMIGISNAIHRRRIRFALEKELALEKEIEDEKERQRKGGGKQEEYDIFLSYRRDGGSDFAQLLKLQLQIEYNFKVRACAPWRLRLGALVACLTPSPFTLFPTPFHR